MTMFKNTEYTPDVTQMSIRQGQQPADLPDQVTTTPMVQIASPDYHKEWKRDSKYEFHDETSSNVYAFGFPQSQMNETLVTEPNSTTKKKTRNYTIEPKVSTLKNLTYIMKQGKAKPTYKYALESPFLDSDAASKFSKSRQLSKPKRKIPVGNSSLVAKSIERTSDNKSLRNSLASRYDPLMDEHLLLEDKNLESVEDLNAENANLRRELENQIGLFEQYIQVAKLLRTKEQKVFDGRRKSSVRSTLSSKAKSVANSPLQ
jgi:hypothetical protein